MSLFTASCRADLYQILINIPKQVLTRFVAKNGRFSRPYHRKSWPHILISYENAPDAVTNRIGFNFFIPFKLVWRVQQSFKIYLKFKNSISSWIHNIFTARYLSSNLKHYVTVILFFAETYSFQMLKVSTWNVKLLPFCVKIIVFANYVWYFRVFLN